MGSFNKIESDLGKIMTPIKPLVSFPSNRGGGARLLLPGHRLMLVGQRKGHGICCDQYYSEAAEISYDPYLFEYTTPRSTTYKNIPSDFLVEFIGPTAPYYKKYTNEEKSQWKWIRMGNLQEAE